MREAVLFGENLILTREYKTRPGATSFTLKDTIRNCAFLDENVCFMYHINFSFPVVDESAKAVFSKGKVRNVATGVASEYTDELCTMTAPVDNLPEAGGWIEFEGDRATARLINPKLKDMKGVYVTYDRKNFPYFSFWKSMGSGDYVVGYVTCREPYVRWAGTGIPKKASFLSSNPCRRSLLKRRSALNCDLYCFIGPMQQSLPGMRLPGRL